jgi:hypothetical protein
MVLVFFARYQWRRERDVSLALFTDAMKEQMRATMEEIKAQKERKGDHDIILGHVKTLAGYENFMGRFEQNLSSIIGAAEVNLMYVIREEKPVGGCLLRRLRSSCTRFVIMGRSRMLIIAWS